MSWPNYSKELQHFGWNHDRSRLKMTSTMTSDAGNVWKCGELHGSLTCGEFFLRTEHSGVVRMKWGTWPEQCDVMGKPGTWWFIPLSKWVIIPVISGLTPLIPFITRVVIHLLSGMNHQVANPSQLGLIVGATQLRSPWFTATSHNASENSSLHVRFTLDYLVRSSFFVWAKKHSYFISFPEF